MVDNKHEELELKFNSDAASDELALAREELAADLAASDDEDNAASMTIIRKTAPLPAPPPEAEAAAPVVAKSDTPPDNVLRSRMPVNRPAGTPPLPGAAAPTGTAPVRFGGKSYGMLLRELREQRKLNYQTIEEMTRIAPRYLEALEREDLEALPPLVYVIAYIRTLCRFYGVGEEPSVELIKELKSQMEYACTDELLNTVEIDNLGTEAHERLLRRILWIGVGALAVLGLIIGLWVFLATRSAAPKTPATTPTTVRSPGTAVAGTADFDSRKLEPLLEPPTLELTRLPVAE